MNQELGAMRQCHMASSVSQPPGRRKGTLTVQLRNVGRHTNLNHLNLPAGTG
jgi:hypothetical protein